MYACMYIHLKRILLFDYCMIIHYKLSFSPFTDLSLLYMFLFYFLRKPLRQLNCPLYSIVAREPWKTRKSIY